EPVQSASFPSGIVPVTTTWRRASGPISVAALPASASSVPAAWMARDWGSGAAGLSWAKTAGAVRARASAIRRFISVPLEEFVHRLAARQHRPRTARVVEILRVHVDAHMTVYRGEHVLWRFRIFFRI